MEIGTQIEHYVIMNHIGRGGMADVWSAQDTRLKRIVAVKTISRNLSDEQDYSARFQVEAQTIAELEHPHILPIYGFGEFNQQLYIVMRYVSGGTLFDRLVDGPLPPDEVLRIGRALASALDYAHERQVVHLDLKPLNVLIDAHGLPYLADFGLAMRVGPEGQARSDSASGSVGYMAPEQLSAGPLDPRTDVFSFGVLLYHLFTGELPFGENSLTGLLVMSGEILPDPSERVAGLPAAMADVLRQATAISLEDRLPSASELVDQLVDLIEGSDEAPLFDMDMLEYEVPETDPELLARIEAQDLYYRAFNAWGQGQGQFVLGMNDFLVVSGYYRPGGDLADELADEGSLLMLRGAIEYDADIAMWRAVIDDSDAQREVCMHVLRTGLPAARARAIDLLAELPDTNPPTIVRHVARALGGESDLAVRAASIHLMDARGSKPRRWRDAAYTPSIDERLAEEAVRAGAPDVAEAAAQTIGRLRSGSAAHFLAAWDAVRALAYVRDEAGSLPDSLPTATRARVFWHLTQSKLEIAPLLWRFVVAAAAGMLGFGGVIFTLYPRKEAIFLADRMLDSVGVGVPAGLLLGLMILLVSAIPERLRGLWPPWLLLPLSWALATGVAVVPFMYYYIGFLNIPDPPVTVIVAGAWVMSGSILFGGALGLPAWGRLALAVLGVGLPPVVAHSMFVDGQIEQPLIYFADAPQAHTLSLLLGLCLSVGAYLLTLRRGLLGLASGLLTFSAQLLLWPLISQLAWGMLLGSDTTAAGLLLVTYAMLVGYAAAGLIVGFAALDDSDDSNVRAAAFAAFGGSAVYSLLYVILMPVANIPVSPGLRTTLEALYSLQVLGGPVLTGAAVYWLQSRRS